jgi:hypothetical protein
MLQWSLCWMVHSVLLTAGESKAFARQLAERLGGHDGKYEAGLGFRAFLAQDALVPGDAADEVAHVHPP